MSLRDDLAALGLQLAQPEQYEKDESGSGNFPPQAVVQARNAQDVQAVLKFARSKPEWTPISFSTA